MTNGKNAKNIINYMTKPYKIKKLLLSIAAIITLPALLTGCGKKEEEAKTEILPTAVKTQTMADSKVAQNNLDLPGIVVAESEAKIIAKASGNAAVIKFNIGDKVNVGTELMKIDDINDNSTGAGFNSSQVKQAIIAVNQAQTNYQMAKTNYDNLVLSSAKDIHQAEIGRDQAFSGKNNTSITTAEAIKSAELALETANLGVEQAKNNLDNKKKQLDQSKIDTYDNANTSAEAVAATCANAITTINNNTGIDEKNSVDIPYRSSLGAMDSSYLTKLKGEYFQAKTSFVNYNKNKNSNINDKLASVIKLAEDCKNMAETYRDLLDKSIPSSVLPQASLSTMQSNSATMVNQLVASLLQATAVKQGLTNVDLNNNSVSDSLDRAYELAKKQQEQASQALNNLKAGNNSQLDQANFSAISAENQYENLKVKINTQIAVAKNQLDLAELQYQNAGLALQGLYDNRLIISPIQGTITKKLIADGDAVSVGQLLATVSETTNVKVQFYVDQDLLTYLMPGMNVNLVNSDSKEINGIITAISPQADAATKRFLVEVKPDINNSKPEELPIGTVVNVKINVKKTVVGNGNIILPLSAVNIGQNESFIFIAENGVAKKQTVSLGEVHGEFAEIKVELNPEAAIIIDGSRLLSDGQKIEIK